MTLPRLAVRVEDPREGVPVRLGPDQAQHLRALRLKPGAALELLLAEGPWRADLAMLTRESAEVRLVAPLQEDREAVVQIDVYLPLTAQLALVDEMIPPLVELGAARLIPVQWARSEFDARKTLARMDRWRKLVVGAAEQSHRSCIPVLEEPAPFAALLHCEAAQRWLAHEVAGDAPNPPLGTGAIALASGPEGGISEGESADLEGAGWQRVALGRSILRAVTAPVALLGAVQCELGRSRPFSP